MTDTLNRYLEEAGKDTSLDVFTVRDVQSRLPAIKHKWVGRLIRAKRKLNELYDERDSIKHNLMDRAKDEAAYKVSDVALEKSINKTKAVCSINTEIKDCRLLIDFLEKTEKIFSSMTFDIKNLSEIMKLETM